MKTFLKLSSVLFLAGLAHSLSAFTYSDSDLLLVFRKTGSSDVLFNLGSVSNELGHANGASWSVTNYNFNLVHSNFGDLSGVTYILMAVTTSDDPASRT